MIALGEVLKLAPDPHPVEPSRRYPNVGIYSFGRGLFRKPDVDGMTTSANTLYRVRAGQLVYSRLFAFEGAYGVVPLEFDGCFVSNEFPSFDIDPARAHPAYVGWLFRNLETWRALAASSTGMGNRRQRIHPERIVEHRVDLPPLAEQQRIAAQLDRIAAEVVRRRAAAQVVDAELKGALRAAFERVIAGAPRVRMGDVAPLVRRPVEISADSRYQEIGVRSFGRGLFAKPDLVGADLTWQKLFRVESGDIVFSNIKAWEGAFAVARPEHHGKVGSHRYLTCVAEPSRASPDFIWYYLQCPEGLAQVEAASPGSADRNRTLAQDRLGGIMLPLPSMDAQHWFDALQQKAAEVRKAQAANDYDLNTVLPAMLGRLFNGA